MPDSPNTATLAFVRAKIVDCFGDDILERDRADFVGVPGFQPFPGFAERQLETGQGTADTWR